MAPYLEININVLSTQYFQCCGSWTLVFYVFPRSVRAEELSEEWSVYIVFFSMHVGFANPVILFQTSQRIYKNIQNIGMHKPWGCVIALNFVVAWEAIGEEWKVPLWTRTRSWGHFSSPLVWQDEDLGGGHGNLDNKRSPCCRKGKIPQLSAFI